MSIFDEMKNRTQSQLKTDAQSAVGNLESAGTFGDEVQSFTFAALPESLAELKSLRKRRWIRLLKRRP